MDFWGEILLKFSRNWFPGVSYLPSQSCDVCRPHYQIARGSHEGRLHLAMMMVLLATMILIMTMITIIILLMMVLLTKMILIMMLMTIIMLVMMVLLTKMILIMAMMTIIILVMMMRMLVFVWLPPLAGDSVSSSE